MFTRSVEPAARHQGAPGQMTAVMRAMRPATGVPRVLRIGLVEGGRVREEHILKERATVTVGQSERATFVLPGDVPQLIKLFERVGDDYYVNVGAGMTARVALGTGIQDIRGTTNPQRVRLDDSSRGKVVCGDATFLFQFVEPLPAPVRPQLPLAVKGGLGGQIDWNLTILVALSFLVHFGVIGAMYSDWTDPIVDEGITAGGLVDMVRNLPPAVIENPVDSAPDSPSAPAPSSQAPDKAASTPSPSGPSPSGPSPSRADAAAARARAEEARLNALAAEADALQFQVIGSSKSKSVLDGVLAKSNLPSVDLDPAAAGSEGAARSPAGDLRMAGDGAIVRPGAARPNLTTIVGTGPRSDGKSGKESPTSGPMAQATVGLPEPTVPVPNAEAAIFKLRPLFRSCYTTGLDSDPNMSGKLTVLATIAPNGEVTSAEAESNTGLSGGVVKCLLRRVQGAQFDKTPTGAKMRIPITLLPQSR